MPTDKFEPCDLFRFRELSKDSKQKALEDFCRFNLLYTASYGEAVESERDDWQHPKIRKLIIATMNKLDMQFYEDGETF